MSRAKRSGMGPQVGLALLPSVTSRQEPDVGDLVFGRPSAAAAKVRGEATNGREYWALANEEPQTLAFLRAQLAVTTQERRSRCL